MSVERLMRSAVVSALIVVGSAVAFDAVAKGYAGYGGSTGHFRTSGGDHGTALGVGSDNQTTSGQSGQNAIKENATEAPGIDQPPSSSGGTTRGTPGGNPDCATDAPNAADCGGPTPKR